MHDDRIFWLMNWALGLPLIVINVIIHIMGLALISTWLARTVERSLHIRHARRLAQATRLGLVISLVTVLHGLEAAVWAIAFVLLGALPDLKHAMLYSLGALTSFGHAQIFLTETWQLLGALEALNGLLLMGLTTAFLYSVLLQLRPFQQALAERQK